MKKRFWTRLLCFLGIHDWNEISAAPAEIATLEATARRTCVRCGLWQKFVPDSSGWSSGDWLSF